MLALCFLLIVGIVLVADGIHIHIPRAYLYAAIAFSIVVEALNFADEKQQSQIIIEIWFQFET